MKLCFLMERQYTPYIKWLGTAFKQLDCAHRLTPILMLVFLGCVSIFLALMLKRADKEQGYGLELPSGQMPETT